MDKVKSDCIGNKNNEANGIVVVCTKTQVAIRNYNCKATKIKITPLGHG
jgi:hypothetical protein